MSWLLPLGFLGLIGLAVLLLIYLIKPNYQNKLVSSTVIWKLSLKYQKKRVPISKIKNLLILLMQILILTLCAFILAGPVILEEVQDSDEVVIIIDASASMRAIGDAKTTRFDRAVEDARTLAAKTFDNGGRVSLIFADKDAEYMIHRATSDSRYDFDEQLQTLIEDDACTFGSADIDGALLLANSIVESVPDTHVVMYTSTRYDNHGSVDVRTMTSDDDSEWNVAVLDLRAERTVENTYTFYVDLACYGRNMDVTLDLSLTSVNRKAEQLVYSLNTDPVKMERIRLIDGRTKTITIPTDVAVPAGRASAVPVFSFDDVTANVTANDSIPDDNVFSLFGNILPTMRIQYASTVPNSFFAAAFMSLQTALQDKWDIDFREVQLKKNVTQYEIAEKVETTGFDIYLFEEKALPRNLPTDGVVFLVNPQSLPSSMDLSLASTNVSPLTALEAGEENHPIMKNVFAGNIEVTRYTPLLLHNTDVETGGYVPLMYCEGDAVLACKNTDDSKVVIMSFSVNYSTAAMTYDFPRLIYNIADYYFPYTFDKNVYEVGESVTLNARSNKLQLTGAGINVEYQEFPQVLELTRIGTYTTSQTPVSNNKPVVEKFFVRIPKYESNIMRKEDVLKNQIDPFKRDPHIDDLCVYFAAVLVALLMAERFLQSRVAS